MYASTSRYELLCSLIRMEMSVRCNVSRGICMLLRESFIRVVIEALKASRIDDRRNS